MPYTIQQKHDEIPISVLYTPKTITSHEKTKWTDVYLDIA